MDGTTDIFELRLEKELKDLRELHGVTLNDLNAWEVAQLVHAVERVCSPFSEVNAELAERPVAVGGVWLWPLTVGAQIWIDEHAERWWKGDSRMRILAVAYAMRNARSPEAFAGLTERWPAAKAVLRSALTLPVRLAELYDAICRANGAHLHDAAKPEKSRAEKIKAQAQADFAAMVARLEVESGIPRHAWLWERSADYTFRAYAELHEFAAAFAAGGGNRARMRDELDGALQNLAAVKAGIVERLRVEG